MARVEKLERMSNFYSNEECWECNQIPCFCFNIKFGKPFSLQQLVYRNLVFSPTFREASGFEANKVFLNQVLPNGFE